MGRARKRTLYFLQNTAREKQNLWSPHMKVMFYTQVPMAIPLFGLGMQDERGFTPICRWREIRRSIVE